MNKKITVFIISILFLNFTIFSAEKYLKYTEYETVKEMNKAFTTLLQETTNYIQHKYFNAISDKKDIKTILTYHREGINGRCFTYPDGSTDRIEYYIKTKNGVLCSFLDTLFLIVHELSHSEVAILYPDDMSINGGHTENFNRIDMDIRWKIIEDLKNDDFYQPYIDFYGKNPYSN